MWQLIAMLCLLVLVTGCGKKVVKVGSTSDLYAQSGERVETYGQMRSPATVMKDGLVDGEKIQMGESTIHPTLLEFDSNPGSENNPALAADMFDGRVGDNSVVTSSSAPPQPEGSMADQGREVSMTDQGPNGSLKDEALMGDSLIDDSLDVVTMSLASTRSGDAAGLVDGIGGTDGFPGHRQSEDRLGKKNGANSRNLRDVHFDFDSWRLSEPARETLEVNAEWLKAHPHEHVTIEGHCDERGTQSYNYALGEKRAAMVQQYLSFLGVPLEQLYVASFGKDRPACLTMTADCFDQNRRAHFNASVNMVSK